ncbi:MAG: recombinase family protein [Fusobacterium sp.]|nr:recombinase family protein [Fusobacterium sp.]MCM1073876.1 recombinase family protein [Bacteroides sp.]
MLKRKVVIIHEQAIFVQKAFELYASGKYSLATLPNELYEQGFKYKLQANEKIPKATLACMLKNIFYTGFYIYPGVENIIKGKHKPIIEQDLFNLVQEVFKSVTPENRQKRHFLYSNLITLQETGKLMIGESKKDKYVYYTAFDNNKKRHSINETVVTDTILNYFKEIRLSLIPKDIVNEVIKEELEPLKKQYSTLKRNKSRKFHKKLQLIDQIKTLSLDDKDFIIDELENIEKLYPDLPKSIVQLENKIKLLTQNCQNIMEKRLYDAFIQMNIQNQRKTIELVKNKLEVQGKRVKLTLNLLSVKFDNVKSCSSSPA